MCETLESAAQQAGDVLLAAIFALSIDKGRKKAVVFQFSGPDIERLVAQRIEPMGLKLESFDNKKDKHIRVVLIDDVLRTKMSIMCECAVRLEQYRGWQKDVDFVCHGVDWRAPDNTPDDKMTLRQTVYRHSYGAHEKIAKVAMKVSGRRLRLLALRRRSADARF